MKLEVKMCHSHLLKMLMCAKQMQNAVHSYSATSPDYNAEGVAGYIETTVTFMILDLRAFVDLYEETRILPSDRIYSQMRAGCGSAG